MKVSVVIPNNGRDISATRQVIGRMADVELIEIDLGRERSIQRNIGISQAKGKYIFILDSDQVPTRYLIEECVAIMDDNPRCVGVYIPEIIIGDDWFSKLRNFERQFYTGTCIDCVRFVRADNCPAFDELQNGTEDSDFDLRIRGQKLVSSNPLYHFDNIEIGEYFRKKNYYAKSLRRFSERNPNAKILNFWYRCVQVYIENGKWKKLLRHPIAALMLVGLLIIRGIIYVKR